MFEEIRREHNSNPLQRQSHVLVVFHVFPSMRQYTTQFLLVHGVMTMQSLYIYILECAGIYNHVICTELMFLIHAVLSTGIHSPSMRSNIHGPYSVW